MVYSIEDAEIAIIKVMKKELSLSKASKLYNIPFFWLKRKVIKAGNTSITDKDFNATIGPKLKSYLLQRHEETTCVETNSKKQVDSSFVDSPSKEEQTVNPNSEVHGAETCPVYELLPQNIEQAAMIMENENDRFTRNAQVSCIPEYGKDTPTNMINVKEERPDTDKENLCKMHSIIFNNLMATNNFLTEYTRNKKKNKKKTRGISLRLEIKLKEKLLKSLQYSEGTVSLKDVRKLIKVYLDKKSREVSSFNRNMPGNTWTWRFIRRHEDLWYLVVPPKYRSVAKKLDGVGPQNSPSASEGTNLSQEMEISNKNDNFVGEGQTTDLLIPEVKIEYDSSEETMIETSGIPFNDISENINEKTVIPSTFDNSTIKEEPPVLSENIPEMSCRSETEEYMNIECQQEEQIQASASGKIYDAPMSPGTTYKPQEETKTSKLQKLPENKQEFLKALGIQQKLLSIQQPDLQKSQEVQEKFLRTHQSKQQKWQKNQQELLKVQSMEQQKHRKNEHQLLRVKEYSFVYNQKIQTQQQLVQESSPSSSQQQQQQHFESHKLFQQPAKHPEPKPEKLVPSHYHQTNGQLGDLNDCKKKCPMCDKYFNEESILGEHIQRFHMPTIVLTPIDIRPKPAPQISDESEGVPLSEESPPKLSLVCEVCGENFDEVSMLKWHYILQHQVMVHNCSVPNCNKIFYSNTELSLHKKHAHSMFRCLKCKTNFKNAIFLNTHVCKFHCHFKKIQHIC